MAARTYLFVPGNRPERFAKALASGADAVVLDLEDAVAAEAKPAARDAIAQCWAQASDAERARMVLRTNDAASRHFQDDLRLLREVGLPAVMLPKAEADDQVRTIRSTAPNAAVLPLIETARGLACCERLAAADGVQRLTFGTLDFALDLDLDIGADNEPLAEAAARLVLASRLAGRLPPVAGVTPQIDDEARLLADLTWSRRRGLAAKLCIHPRQVAPIHTALAPDAAAIAWARRVIAAELASPGAAQVDGRMVDRPVVLQAQRTLARAGL
jgi:citrate lyase subunit beta / citryl-CoA lyase